MWYEIIPVFTIITGLMAFPQVSAYFINSFFQNGNPCKRDLTQQMNRRQFLRDIRLTGNTYVINGLEVIPDEEEDKK